jgi:hypothetical protein
MAGKMNVMKLLQEMRGLADFTNRRPPAKLPAFPLGWQASRVAPPRRRRVIRVAAPYAQDFPHPVKIVHLKDKPGVAPGTQTP